MALEPWSPRDSALVLELYPFVPTADLAEVVRRNPQTVLVYAHRHGKRKSPSFIRYLHKRQALMPTNRFGQRTLAALARFRERYGRRYPYELAHDSDAMRYWCELLSEDQDAA